MTEKTGTLRGRREEGTGEPKITANWRAWGMSQWGEVEVRRGRSISGLPRPKNEGKGRASKKRGAEKLKIRCKRGAVDVAKHGGRRQTQVSREGPRRGVGTWWG